MKYYTLDELKCETMSCTRKLFDLLTDHILTRSERAFTDTGTAMFVTRLVLRSLLKRSLQVY